MKTRLRLYKDRIKRVLRLRLGRDRQYKIGLFDIRLPAEHLLPEHQSENRLYDRFLPFVAELLPPSSTVIDVGANAGDTLASMASRNNSCSYVCIEPESEFFSFLLKNKSQIMSRYPHMRIDLHQQILSSNGIKRGLVGGFGTRTTQVDELGGNQCVSLDSIIDSNYDAISFLKIDVDGWDWDVILSSLKLIETHHPIIYFEMYVQTHEALSGYERALLLLESENYEEFYIFDSFGAFIFYTKQISQILEFSKYLFAQAQGKSTQTMFYLDILCGVKGQESSLRTAVKNFASWADI